ncbi:MAG: HEAT repeat domain-containing protein, partial [Desulfobacterales bacterium]|nr:HEAT repeat domain-containing protein [Desulfobacterales bacterium]
MSRHQTSSRQLKKKIQKLLQQKNLESGLAEIGRLPARKAINPLFSFLCSLDELLKWRAVTAMGEVVDRLADEDIESARVIMRRYMWNLNDESGGIGWGCPEAMGEIMARNENLAQEFWCILISYIRSDGNFLEHEILQRGVLWGIGRLAHARPQLLKDSVDSLHPYMQADDPYLRGLAAWASGPLRNKSTESVLKRLKEDDAKLNVFFEGHLKKCSV